MPFGSKKVTCHDDEKVTRGCVKRPLLSPAIWQCFLEQVFEGEEHTFNPKQ